MGSSGASGSLTAFGVLLPEQFGAVAGPAAPADATTGLQAAMTRAGANFAAGIFELRTVYLSGDYRVTAALLTDSGIRVKGPGRIVHDFAGGAAINALFQNRGLSGSTFTKITDVKLEGFTVATTATSTGAIVGLYCDDLSILNVRVDGSAQPDHQHVAYALCGDRIKIIGGSILSWGTVTGNGGIRFGGGVGFGCIGTYVDSGDDALQFCPFPRGALPQLDCVDAAYIGCTGRSRAARFIVAALQSTPGGIADMTAAIKRCKFLACAGYGGSREVMITNTNSSGELSVDLLDCTVDGSLTSARNTEDVRISKSSNGNGGLGPMRVKIRNLTVRNPAASAQVLLVSTDTTNNADTAIESLRAEIRVEGAIPADLVGQVVSVNGCQSGRVTLDADMSAFPAGTHGINAQRAGTLALTDFWAEDCEILNMPTSGSAFGVRIGVAIGGAPTGAPTGGIRRGVISAAGSTRAFSLAGGVGLVAEGVDCSGVAAATKYASAVTDAAIRGCKGINPLGHGVTQPAVPAAGTALANTTGFDCTVTVAGGNQTNIAIGGTNTGLTSGAFRLPAGQTITLVGYTTAPTWTWFAD